MGTGFAANDCCNDYDGGQTTCGCWDLLFWGSTCTYERESQDPLRWKRIGSSSIICECPSERQQGGGSVSGVWDAFEPIWERFTG